MRPATPVASLVVTALVMFAGCLGGASPKRATEEPPIPPTAPPPKFTEDTCALTGIVVDDEWVPVAGAEVSIHSLGEVSLTALDGSYSFNSIPPGIYRLTAARDEYQLTEPQDAECAPGGVTQVHEIVLIRLASIQHVFTVQRVGKVGCSAHVSTAPFQDYCMHLTHDAVSDFKGNSSVFTLLPEGNLTGMVIELDWDPNVGMAGGSKLHLKSGSQFANVPWQFETNGEYRTTVNTANTANNKAIHVQGPPPLKLRVWTEDGGLPMSSDSRTVSWYVEDYAAASTSADGGVVLDQEFTFYAAFFINNATIPNGYSQLPR